ncbi:MAG: hypothetical protein ABSG53_10755 [Thermoguttaceae bacterium]
MGVDKQGSLPRCIESLKDSTLDCCGKFARLSFLECRLYARYSELACFDVSYKDFTEFLGLFHRHAFADAVYGSRKIFVQVLLIAGARLRANLIVAIQVISQSFLQS